MEDIITHTDIMQCSDEWHQLRLGKITGSNFYKLMGSTNAREKYLYDIANEIVTGCKSDGDDFSNIHMERGKLYENIARMEYVGSKLVEVFVVGLVQRGHYTTCSPDGLVDEDGIIEIKVPDSNNYFRMILEIAKNGDKAISIEHYLQMQYNLYICGRQWCDYVLYNSKHAQNNAHCFIYRVERDNDLQEKIKATIKNAIQTIESHVISYQSLIDSSFPVLKTESYDQCILN